MTPMACTTYIGRRCVKSIRKIGKTGLQYHNVLSSEFADRYFGAIMVEQRRFYMEENYMNGNPVSDSIDALRNEIADSNRKIKCLIVLVVLLIVLCGYLCYVVFRSTNSTGVIDSTHRVLIVSLENGLSDSYRSDKTQMKNALEDGGMVRIRPTNEDIIYSVGIDYLDYGASDSDGNYWTIGALLNYIASRGWTLVQTPSTGLSSDYYFIK